MTDTSKTKQVRVNPEPFQMLDREIVRARKTGGIFPPGSTNATIPQNCVFLKSDDYSSTKNKESSGSDSSKHSRARHRLRVTQAVKDRVHCISMNGLWK